MPYDLDCLTKLLKPLPLLALRRPYDAEKWLSHLADTAQALAPTLAQYPHVRFEPLDACYVLLQGQAVISAVLPEVLKLGENGRTYAGLLLALTPEAPVQSFLDLPDVSPGGSWWRQRVRAPRGLAPIRESVDDVLERLRTLLDICVRPDVRLLLAMSLEAVLARKVQVHEAYRTGGADAALEVIRGAPGLL